MLGAKYVQQLARYSGRYSWLLSASSRPASHDVRARGQDRTGAPRSTHQKPCTHHFITSNYGTLWVLASHAKSPKGASRVCLAGDRQFLYLT